MGPNPLCLTSLQEEKRHRQTQGAHHVTTQAAHGVMQLHNKERLGWEITTTRCWEEAQKDLTQSRRASRGPADTLTWDFRPLEPGENGFLAELHSLWHLATAYLGT